MRNNHTLMKPDFEKLNGLVPAIIQDAETRNVLMLGYMNSEALQKTLTDKRVTFFSRSKNRLWTKGEESGNFLNVVAVSLDCDSDTLLIKVNPEGPVCHTGTGTCWGEENKPADLDFVNKLEGIIANRKATPNANSYTSGLFQSGINKVAQKVGEEATELIIEAKDNNDELFVNEAADLLFHYLVLLQAKNKTLNDVVDVLRKRHS